VHGPSRYLLRGGGTSMPARRAFDKPMATTCFIDRAPCLPDRTCSISSRTNSPACVVGAFPARRARSARRSVSGSGMMSPLVICHNINRPRTSWRLSPTSRSSDRRGSIRRYLPASLENQRSAPLGGRAPQRSGERTIRRLMEEALQRLARAGRLGIVTRNGPSTQRPFRYRSIHSTNLGGTSSVTTNNRSTRSS
jgi:hypothetical protein